MLIRCRVAACPAGRGTWEFFLLNDSDAPLDGAVLKRVAFEWGNMSDAEEVDVRIAALAPGAYALIWRDTDNCAEGRVELLLQVSAGQQERNLTFEFPKLYKLRELPLVPGLGKAGWQESAELSV